MKGQSKVQNVVGEKGLAEDDKKGEEQVDGSSMPAYRKSIEKECDEEAIKDEKMLQKKLDEAVREIMSDDE